MSRNRWLAGTALALPLVLLWVAGMGVLNQRLDRSAAVTVSAVANWIEPSAVVGPRLLLSGELFQDRSIGEVKASPGQDVWLRYLRSGNVWAFSEARAASSSRAWSATEIDLPARVKRGRAEKSGLVASPLLSDAYAISRSVLSSVRREARLELRLRAGAFGAVWVESAVERSEPLGELVALLPGPEELCVVGTTLEKLGPERSDSRHGEEGLGWLARLGEGGFLPAKPIEGVPVGAVRLADGRLFVATTAGRYARSGFRVAETSLDKVDTSPVPFLALEFRAFARDGSVWARETERPGSLPQMGLPLAREEARFVRMSLDRRVLARFSIEEPRLAGIQGDFVLAGGALVQRFQFGPHGLEETDRWTVEGAGRVLFPREDLGVAVGKDGVYFLRPGQERAEKVLPLAGAVQVQDIAASESGDLLVLTRTQQRADVDDYGASTVLTTATFLPAGGAPVPLGEVRARTGNEDRVALRLARRADRLYLLGNGEILSFDLSSRKLRARLDERPAASSRRVF